MIATFKETIGSIKDLKYGSAIVKKSVGQSLWYWTKYLILFAVLGMGVGIAALTYYTPQLPKLAQENLPDIQVTVKDGKITTNAQEPFVRGDENFSFIIDTKGDVSDLDKFKTGILVLSDRVVAKSENETRIIAAKELGDVTGNRQMVVDWLKNNQTTLLAIGVLAILLMGIFLGGFFWIWQVAGFAFWALIMFVAAKLMKKKIDYANAFKIVVYASVISMILRVLLSLVGIPELAILSLAGFLFYALSWVYNLNTK